MYRTRDQIDTTVHTTTPGVFVRPSYFVLMKRHLREYDLEDKKATPVYVRTTPMVNNWSIRTTQKVICGKRRSNSPQITDFTW